MIENWPEELRSKVRHNVGDDGEIEPGGDDSSDDSEARTDREQARGTEAKGRTK